MYRFWYRRYFFDCLTVLLDISVTFFGMNFERKSGKFLLSVHNFHLPFTNFTKQNLNTCKIQGNSRILNKIRQKLLQVLQSIDF